MDRKKTILIAVMINAGLLAVLFIAALTTQEESVPSMELMQAPAPKLEKPLFPDAADMALQKPSTSVAPPPVQIPLPETPRSAPEAAPAETSAPSSPMVHKLPPLVPEARPPMPQPPAPQAAARDPSHVEVTVKKGDSLDKIARAHGTTVDEIIKTNRLPSSFLREGQVLKLPAQKIAAAPKPKPAAVEKPLSSSGPEYYTVKVGDNPWTIAMKHHMKVEELLKLNNLNEERARKLKPGDRLRIR